MSATKPDILDDGEIRSFTIDVSVDNGYNFGTTTRFVAWLMLAFGLVFLVNGGPGYFIGPVVLLASTFVLTSKYGTHICLSNKYIREYSTLYFFKRGNWIPTHTLPDVSVLRIGRAIGQVRYSTGAEINSVDVTMSEVYLLSQNHRMKVLLKVCKSTKEANLFAAEMAEKMGKNFVPFNPVISEKTKARRMG